MLLHSSRFYTCHWDSRMAVLRVTSSHSLPLLTSAIWFLFLHIWGLQPKSSPRKLLLLFQSLTSLVCESLGPQSPSSNLILRLPSWVLQVIAPSVMIGYWLWSFYFLHLQHGYSTQLCEVIRSCFTLVFLHYHVSPGPWTNILFSSMTWTSHLVTIRPDSFLDDPWPRVYKFLSKQVLTANHLHIFNLHFGHGPCV